jgi:hypothetical protein
MALRLKKDVQKASYYVWFLGAQEAKELRGERVLLSTIPRLIERSRHQEPLKVTLQVSHKGLKIIQVSHPVGLLQLTDYANPITFGFRASPPSRSWMEKSKTAEKKAYARDMISASKPKNVSTKLIMETKFARTMQPLFSLLWLLLYFLNLYSPGHGLRAWYCMYLIFLARSRKQPKSIRAKRLHCYW